MLTILQRALLAIGMLMLLVACGDKDNPSPSSPPPAPQAEAVQPDPTPILRIEPGMHFAMINRIDVDAAERFVVSAAVQSWEQKQEYMNRWFNLADHSL